MKTPILLTSAFVGRRRVAELEKKLDDVYTLVQAGQFPQHATTSPGLQPAACSAPATTIDRSHFTPADGSLLLASQAGNLGTPESLPAIEESFGRADVIQKGIISEQRAGEFIEAFETDFSSFPFLTIPSSCALGSIRSERPFLLLAILTIASRKNLTLQESLEKEFRETLGTRLIVEASKDLDLLQGLIVYIAW